MIYDKDHHKIIIERQEADCGTPWRFLTGCSTLELSFNRAPAREIVIPIEKAAGP